MKIVKELDPDGTEIRKTHRFTSKKYIPLVQIIADTLILMIS